MTGRPGLRGLVGSPVMGIMVAAIVGGGLVVDCALRSSATYDEVAYLQVGAAWWRTGQDERITRMGSPLTFWKLQQAPALMVVDRLGLGVLIDKPDDSQAVLLPAVRLASLWVWLAALLLTTAWAWREHGERAAVLAAWLFALSPNLVAHGALITMEMPLIAASAAMFLLFARFLRSGDRRAFWACAAVGGLAFSCKFTAVVLPLLLGLAWWMERRRASRGFGPDIVRVALGMTGFLGMMALANIIVTAGALLPLSERRGSHPTLDHAGTAAISSIGHTLVETPIPQDWAGFARQLHHQRGGGPSYLFGQRRMTGWWYYYLVCLAVKVPLSVWLLVVSRLVMRRAVPTTPGDRLAVVVVVATLVLVAVGSSRNYGIRYLLWLAPAVLVATSSLMNAGRWGRRLACLGVLGQAVAIASIHPYELSFFPILIGGAEGGRQILADSNLDWGQGARTLARLQRSHAEFRDMTVYYFGDTSPSYYGVEGRCYVINAQGPIEPLPSWSTVSTKFVAISRSLQDGPWGPAAYFRPFDAIKPVAILEDHTMAIYRTDELRGHTTASGATGS